MTSSAPVPKKARSEVIKMSMQTIEKPASERQMAYINRLKMEIGENGPGIIEEISSAEASMIIGELIAKTQTFNGTNGRKKINEARLGMAMKECFRLWTGLGRDIWKERRETFIDEALNTYFLFTEIVERLDENFDVTR